jgi:hypothetical protein
MSVIFGTPNLFILGAAKCGTTSLYNIVSRHADIQVSSVKEPSFFCSYFQDVSNPIGYFSLFDDRRKWRVDSSHVYLTNPESPQILSRLFPQARFILILRDPVKRTHALYRHMRRYLHGDGQPYEPIPDFQSAVQVEDARYHSPQFWRECRQYPWNFFYWRSSLYGEQIERYLQLFPRDQFLVLSMAQLARDPHDLCRKIAGFLELDAAPLLDGEDWHFNADSDVQDPPPEALSFLQSRLGGVQAQVEDLFRLSLDFSM